MTKPSTPLFFFAHTHIAVLQSINNRVYKDPCCFGFPLVIIIIIIIIIIIGSCRTRATCNVLVGGIDTRDSLGPRKFLSFPSVPLFFLPSEGGLLRIWDGERRRGG